MILQQLKLRALLAKTQPNVNQQKQPQQAHLSLLSQKALASQKCL